MSYLIGALIGGAVMLVAVSAFLYWILKNWHNDLKEEGLREPRNIGNP